MQGRHAGSLKLGHLPLVKIFGKNPEKQLDIEHAYRIERSGNLTSYKYFIFNAEDGTRIRIPFDADSVFTGNCPASVAAFRDKSRRKLDPK
jgi:hypothetical protein